MPGFNTLPVVGGGGGQANMTFVGSIHMNTYNRSWAQGGTPGYYALYSTNQENGYAYFVGATTTGVALNRLANITHSFTRIDIIAPVNDMVSLYKGKVKTTTEFTSPFAAFSSFPSVITSSGNFVLPNNALPLVNILVAGPGGGGGGSHHGAGGGGGGGIVKLTAYQAVGTTPFTSGSVAGHVANGGGGGGHNNDTGNRAGGTGFVQTSSTGLGVSGSPIYTMTLYAKINSENVVENVILCEDSEIITQAGIHIKVTDLTKNASIGQTYDAENNKFIAPKPFESWTLNESFDWVSPIGESPEGLHTWDEENQEWVPVVSS
jgi:hypothetical protein